VQCFSEHSLVTHTRCESACTFWMPIWGPVPTLIDNHRRASCSVAALATYAIASSTWRTIWARTKVL